MNCPRCNTPAQDGSVFCSQCGKKLVRQRRTKQKRPNGTGSVQPRNGSWEARVVDHYERTDQNKSGLRPVWKTKGGFRTKREALNYLPTLIASSPANHDHPVLTFQECFLKWKEQHSQRVGQSTLSGYTSAFKHFSSLYSIKMDCISAVDLQKCIDACPYGKRIKQLMKVTANLIFKYAIDDKQITMNAASNLWTGNGETTHFEPLTDDEIARIEQSGLEYADYVVAMCYLGHRPAEFFGFLKSDLRQEGDTYYLFGGVKTEAGRSRAVTIPPKILPILLARLKTEGTDYLFPRSEKDRDGKHKCYSKMPTNYFSRFVWKPMMEQLGIIGKVPYATRHTYANKMKRVSGDEKDKAGLMGHASYSTTREHYQITTLPEKKAITDQMN